MKMGDKLICIPDNDKHKYFFVVLILLVEMFGHS